MLPIYKTVGLSSCWTHNRIKYLKIPQTSYSCCLYIRLSDYQAVGLIIELLD